MDLNATPASSTLRCTRLQAVRAGAQASLGGFQRVPTRLGAHQRVPTTARAVPAAAEVLDVPLFKHFQEEIVVEGLLHVTPVQAGSCMWERFGSLDQLSSSGLEGAPSLRSALNESDGNQTLTEAICLATPVDAPEEQSPGLSVFRQITNAANDTRCESSSGWQLMHCRWNYCMPISTNFPVLMSSVVGMQRRSCAHINSRLLNESCLVCVAAVVFAAGRCKLHCR